MRDTAAITGLILSMASVYALEIYKKRGKYKKYPVVKGGDAWYVAPPLLRFSTVLFYGIAATSLLKILSLLSSVGPSETLAHPLASSVLTLLLSIVHLHSKDRQTRQHKRLSVAGMFFLSMVLADWMYNCFNG